MTSRRQVIKLPHHEQAEFCTSRSSYRQGRRLTAVKVYTVNDESQHLIVSGVPSLGLQDDLRRLCSRFGDVTSLVFIPNYTDEKFAESYHIRYARIQSARFAKKHIDGRTFYGGSLHVCYAPEMESVSETRSKLLLRRRDVSKRCHGLTLPSYSKELRISPSQQGHPNADMSFHDSNPTWNNTSCVLNSRLLPADTLEEVSVQSYGPALPSVDWRDCGVKETRLIPHPQSRIRKICSQEQKPGINKTHSAVPVSTYWAKQISKSFSPSSLHASSSFVGEKPSVPPVLKFVPTQVKGAGKRIIFHQKLQENTRPDTGNASMDATILSVRERIRSVGVPNIKVVFERKSQEKPEIAQS